MSRRTWILLLLAIVFVFAASVDIKYMQMTAEIGANNENLIMQQRATYVAIIATIGSFLTAITITYLALKTPK